MKKASGSKDDHIEQLRKEFRSPGKESRPITWYRIPGADPKLIREDLLHLKGYGLGGICIMPQSSRLESEYLSEEFWETVQLIVDEAVRQDMRVWLYDELDYPSGTAGGRVLVNHPEYQATGLAYQETALRGGAHAEVALPEGEPVAVLAEKASEPGGGFLDLTADVSGGKLLWDAPPGEWKVHAFVKQTTCKMLKSDWAGEHKPYVNIMDSGAIREFISLNYEGYARTLGRHFGEGIEAIFTDEPALHIAGWWNSKITEDRLPMLPWVAGFGECFHARKGYEIEPMLPYLLRDLGPEASKVRCDYWEVVSDLIFESYFVQISQWCKRHGIAFTGHLLLEESLMLHLMFSGSLMRCLAIMDIPGIDLLGSTLGETMPEWGGPWVPKFASSAAHTRGKSEVMSESFAGSGAEMPLETLIAMANWQFVLGITELLPMSLHYYHNPRGRASEEALKDFKKGAFFDDPSFYATYLGRLKMFLGGGRHVADVALLMPETSIQANYTPAGIGLDMDEYRKASPVAAEIDDAFLALTEGLLENQIDFDYLDDEAFLGAQIDGGKFRVADETYSVLLLPSCTTLRWAVVEKLRDFRLSGGIVIAVGKLPHEAVERGKDDAVKEAVAELFESQPAGPREGAKPLHASEIDGAIEAIRKGQEADVRLAQPDPKVYCLHKRKGGCDIYFLVNNEEKPKTLDVTFRCRGTAEILEPRTGEIAEAQTLCSAEGTRLSIDLDKLSGLLIVFSI